MCTSNHELPQKGVELLFGVGIGRIREVLLEDLKRSRVGLFQEFEE